MRSRSWRWVAKLVWGHIKIVCVFQSKWDCLSVGAVYDSLVYTLSSALQTYFSLRQRKAESSLEFRHIFFAHAVSALFQKQKQNPSAVRGASTLFMHKDKSRFIIYYLKAAKIPARKNPARFITLGTIKYIIKIKQVGKFLRYRH